MKKTGRHNKTKQSLVQRYRALPRSLFSRSNAERLAAQKLLALTICIPLMIGCLGYMVSWERTRLRIERENAEIRALYIDSVFENADSTDIPTQAPVLTAAPTETPTQAPVLTAVPTETPTQALVLTAVPTETPTQAPVLTAAPTEEPTAVPVLTAAPTEEPTTAPVLTESPNNFEVAVDATIVPLATPDANTIIYAMETPPPEQFAFGDLLALNPETVGFLRIGEKISLPVVQKPNDNEYYLNHSFNLEESIGGTLFLDGSNLLVPEDANLIIYGHNMRNGTMFRPLIGYEQLSFLKENPLVRFDTIYQNRNYVPFAVFTVTADEGSSRYVNIRQFMFEEAEWDAYIKDMRSLSLHSIPVDVQYGDHVLLLVTCEYTHNNGRFVVALRAQRSGEDEQDLIAAVRSAH